MKTATLLGGALSLLLLLATASGCYTQVGTTDDLYSGEYGRGTPGEEPIEEADSVATEDTRYFDDEGYPLNRFYLGVSPSWVYGGVYWSTWSPWVYDPFWCWTQPAYPYWYPGWTYWPHFYYPPAYYGPGYHPPYGGGYTVNSTRRTGTTRGSGTVRAGGGVTRGGEAARGSEVSAPATGRAIDIPAAARKGRVGAADAPAAPKAAPDRVRRGERSGSAGKSAAPAVRGGTGRSRSGESVKTPRRPARPSDAGAPVQGGREQAPPRSGGRESVRPASPPPAPPAGDGGRGSSRPNTQPPQTGSGRGGGRR